MDFEYLPVHLLKDGGQQYSESYLRLNPQGEVPTLVHHGKAIAQSLAILEYIEEVSPARPLLPKDPFARGKIRQMCENINSFLHPMGNLKVLQYLEKTHTYDQKMKEEWVHHWSRQALKATETLLSHHAGLYAFGDEVSFADCFLVPAAFTAERFNVDLEDYPTFRRVVEKCSLLEAFIKAHPLRQIDTPPDIRIS